MLVDVLHLSRNLRRSPASAAAAIVTLSLTLGAGAAIFAVVDAVVLTPPPFTNPDALVVVGEAPIDDPAAAPGAVSYATFDAWRERAGSLAAIEAFDGTNLTLTDLGAAERTSATNVTPGFLTLLGVAPAFGRALTRDDVGQPVAIISDAFWRGKLASDPRVIGRQFVLGGQAHTIVGVLPERFFFALNTCDVWRPFPVSPDEAKRSGYRVHVVARLAPAVTPTFLRVALDDVSRMAPRPARVVATSLAAEFAAGATKALLLLAAAAALAVLVAFTNLGGLLVVRSIDRRRELAVRSALGARPSEIFKLLLLEAETLVAIGTALGVLLALWMTPAVARLALEQFGGIATRNIGVSWAVVGIVSVFAASCAAICASVPSLMAARRGVVDALRRGTTPPPRELAVRRVFVAAEVALAFVLLVSMMFLGRSLLDVLDIHAGFDARGLLKLQVSLPAAGYPDQERVATFYAALQSALEQRLGRHAISIVDEVPLTGNRGRDLVRVRPADAGRDAVVRTTSAGYFDVMRIPIVAGRSFDQRDDASAPARIVVSESFVEHVLRGERPIGRQIWLGLPAHAAEIVGVVGDVKHRALDETVLPTVYLSALQAPSRSNVIVVRSALPDADVVGAVRDEVARLDRDVPVYAVRSMRDLVQASPGVPVRRVLTAAFAGFALLAVALGAVGLFGVAAHDVASRRRELALRIALGADPSHLLRATLAQGALIVGAGLVTGSGLSVWATRVLGSIVVDRGGFDVVGAGGAAAMLAIAGACAVLPAALRAARTDPMIALRAE